MSTILEQDLLLHGRERIIININEIQKTNPKKNRSYAQFFVSLRSAFFSLSPKEE
jgi:hypothetical protein